MCRACAFRAYPDDWARLCEAVAKARAWDAARVVFRESCGDETWWHVNKMDEALAAEREKAGLDPKEAP